MSGTVPCKRCDEPALPDRKLCQAHTDMQKVYQSNYQKKKAGGVKSEKPSANSLVSTKSTAASVATKVAVTRVLPAGDLVAVIQRIRDELDVLEEAQAIIQRRLKAC